MKRILNLSIVLFLITVTMNAQGFEITPQFGYQINSKLNYSGGYLKVPGSAMYGVTASVNLKNGMNAEFSWIHQGSDLLVSRLTFGEENWGGLNVNHYQFGAVQDFGSDEELKPFFGVSVGWSTFSPENNSQLSTAPTYLSSTSTFTFGVSGGIKYMFTNHIGLRVQSQLLMPVYSSYYYGYNYNGYSNVMAMLNFSGGLIFAFGDNKTTFD